MYVHIHRHVVCAPTHVVDAHDNIRLPIFSPCPVEKCHEDFHHCKAVDQLEMRSLPYDMTGEYTHVLPKWATWVAYKESRGLDRFQRRSLSHLVVYGMAFTAFSLLALGVIVR
jgi:hypothetical protein